jgi:flagellar biosynthesis GTPase FlhF
VLPATMTAADATTLVESLAAHRLPSRLLVSHADSAGAGGVPVGLAVAHKLPVSYVASGPAVGALRPAAPDSLARMVLQ